MAFWFEKALNKLPPDQVETGTNISASLKDFEEVDLPAPESTAQKLAHQVLKLLNLQQRLAYQILKFPRV